MTTSEYEHKIDHSYFYKVSSDKHSYLTLHVIPDKWRGMLLI